MRRSLAFSTNLPGHIEESLRPLKQKFVAVPVLHHGGSLPFPLASSPRVGDGGRGGSARRADPPEASLCSQRGWPYVQTDRMTYRFKLARGSGTDPTGAPKSSSASVGHFRMLAGPETSVPRPELLPAPISKIFCDSSSIKSSGAGFNEIPREVGNTSKGSCFVLLMISPVARTLPTESSGGGRIRPSDGPSFFASAGSGSNASSAIFSREGECAGRFRFSLVLSRPLAASCLVIAGVRPIADARLPAFSIAPILLRLQLEEPADVVVFAELFVVDRDASLGFCSP
eukprot:scaffold334_cov241-Pinguiococcus_pyrenoidosus.AAC.59